MSISNREALTVGALIWAFSIWLATQFAVVLAIRWLWNVVMPEVFNGPSLTLLQAAAFFYLVRLTLGPPKVKTELQQ